MKPDPSKLRHQQQQEHAMELHQTQKQTAREFASVEELIRCDAEQTPAPPEIAERLNTSIAQEPKRARSWWRRFFSRHD